MIESGVGEVMDAANRALLRVRPQTFDVYRERIEGLSGRITPGGFHRRVAMEAIYQNFEEACGAAASVVGELLAEQSKEAADDFLSLLLDRTDYWTTLYGALLGSQHLTPNDESVEQTLRRDLKDIAQNVVRDMRLNLIGGKRMTSPRPEIQITANGSNVAINSPAAVQRLRQDVIPGVSYEQVLEELAALSTKIAESTAPADDINAVQDAIVSAQREIASETPDTGRLKRLVKGVVERAEKVGIGAAGAVLSRLLLGG